MLDLVLVVPAGNPDSSQLLPKFGKQKVKTGNKNCQERRETNFLFRKLSSNFLLWNEKFRMCRTEVSSPRLGMVDSDSDGHNLYRGKNNVCISDGIAHNLDNSLGMEYLPSHVRVSKPTTDTNHLSTRTELL